MAKILVGGVNFMVAGNDLNVVNYITVTGRVEPVGMVEYGKNETYILDSEEIEEVKIKAQELYDLLKPYFVSAKVNN